MPENVSQNETWPPITHEAECEPVEMTPEQAEAWRKYWECRPDDFAERQRLRAIMYGEKSL